MEQRKQVSRNSGALSKTETSRGDKASAAIVKKGITLQQIHGTQYAADFLKEKNIDMEIVMRVLLNLTEQRRHDDLLEFIGTETSGRATYV